MDQSRPMRSCGPRRLPRVAGRHEQENPHRMTSNRALRLGSLSTAAAVLVGLAVATAGPAHADADLKVVHDQIVTISGLQHIVGEVVNNGSSAAAAHVDATLTLAGGI